MTQSLPIKTAIRRSGPNASGQTCPSAALDCTTATKAYRLAQLPPVLLLHLKRFRRDAAGRLHKVGVHIAFDPVIDLIEAAGQARAEGASADASAQPTPLTSANGGGNNSSGGRCRQQQCASNPYRLVGVVEHRGSLKSGHYVAYVSRQDALPVNEDGGGTRESAAAWYLVSDACVQPVTWLQVAAAQAYVLMYSCV